MQKTLLVVDMADSHGAVGTLGAIKMFQAHRYYGAAVTTAVAASNSMGIQALRLVEPDVLGLQMEAVLSDMPVDGVMVGFLGSDRAVDIVASLLSAYKVDHLLVDPCLYSRQDVALSEPDVAVAAGKRLFSVASLVCMNLKEASVLSGRPVSNVQEMKDAARFFLDAGVREVVIKGGRLPGPRCPEVVGDAHGIHMVDGPRMPQNNFLGAGTAFNAIVLAALCRNMKTLEAVDRAKKWIGRAANHPFKIGAGAGPVNPTSPPAF